MLSKVQWDFQLCRCITIQMTAPDIAVAVNPLARSNSQAGGSRFSTMWHILAEIYQTWRQNSQP